MPIQVRLLDTIDGPAIGDYLASQFDRCEQCLMAVAYGSYYAFDSMGPHIKGMLRRSGELRVVLDTQSLITAPDLIEEFATVPGDSRCKIYAAGQAVNEANARSFHPKLFCFKRDEQCEFLIGSANFTHGGLAANIEASAVVSCHASDPFAESAYALWRKIWHHENVLVPSYKFIERYRQLHLRFKPLVADIEGELTTELDEILAEEVANVVGGGGEGLSYLLGLICGSGEFADDSGPTRFGILFESGERRPQGAPPGTIAAPGISEYSADQRQAMATDAARIEGTLNDWLRASGQGEVSATKSGPFAYHFHVTLNADSTAAGAVAKLLSEGRISSRRFYPAKMPSFITQANDNEISLAFFRGYFDVRGRISAADRAGTNGPLRIQVSVSQNAGEFGRELYNAMASQFAQQHTNYLHGPDRNRETMIRMEAQEVPTQLFTSAWQQILHHDFAKYNETKFARDNRFQGKFDFEA